MYSDNHLVHHLLFFYRFDALIFASELINTKLYIMKKIIITALTILFIGNGFAQDNDTLLQNKLIEVEEELNTVFEISKAAGFAIAIVKGKEVVYSNGFGYRDLENKLPVTTNTVFPIGSATKAFTASLIGILEDQGEVDVNKSPREYIPELEFYNSEMNAQITIKDLMTHRTGLPRHDGSWKSFRNHSKEEFLARIEFQEPVAPVRSKWIYNNFMYMLQGSIVERITENTWAQNIEQNLFEPLEMTNSNTNIDALKKNSEAAIGYYFEESINTKIDYYDIAAMDPAGAINSSVDDMSKWMMAWLNNGEYNGRQVIPSAYLKAAMRSQMVIAGRLPRKNDPNTFMSNYGYGWFLSSYKGHYRVDHGGNIDGFTANVTLYPSDSLGIVILTNQNGSGLPQTVRNLISDLMLDAPETEDWMARLEMLVEHQTKVQEANIIESVEPAHALEQYTGTYTHKGYGTLEVHVKNDSLFAVYPLKKVWLNPVHPGVFDTYSVVNGKVETEVQDDSIKFNSDFKGKIIGLEIGIERKLDPIVFSRDALIIAD